MPVDDGLRNRFGPAPMSEPESELETSDGVIVLAGTTDDAGAWLRTGEGLSALWLKATEGGLSYSRELIELIRDEYDFAIGAACFPEVHIHAESADSDLRYCKEKVDAGARFLITQLFFENANYWEFVGRARDIGIDVPIIPGIMPITNFEQIDRFTRMCGATIPMKLRLALETLDGLERVLAGQGREADVTWRDARKRRGEWIRAGYRSALFSADPAVLFRALPALAQDQKAPPKILIITGDADVATLEHSVALFRLLGGGGMGDMGQPLPASRLAVLPATSHTAVITQTELLHSFIEPFLKGETPKGFFEASGAP